MFLNECEECGAEYQATPRGRETWFTLCAPCLAKEKVNQGVSDSEE